MRTNRTCAKSAWERTFWRRRGKHDQGDVSLPYSHILHYNACERITYALSDVSSVEEALAFVARVKAGVA